MKKYNDILDNALDSMIDEAANMVAGKDEEILFDTDEDILFSKEHEEKMKKFFKTEKRKSVIKKFPKYLKYAACAAVVCIAVSGVVSIFSDDSSRVRFLNFVYESDKPNTRYNFSERGDTRYTDNNFILGYMPTGFKLTESSANRMCATLYFESENNYFTVDATNIDVNSMIDTENATIQRMIINGHEAVLISNHNGNYIVWHDNVYSYSVIGDLSVEETIKIAENMEFIGELKKD